MGRFINSDSVIANADGSLLGYNLFAYCFNNPINMSDTSGEWPELSTVLLAVAAISITIAVAATIVATCGTAAALVASCAGTVISTTTVTAAATVVASQTANIAVCAAAASLVSNQVETELSKTYSVYFLEDESGKIQYVGRVADSGYSSRMAYHKATRGLTPAYRVPGLNYAEARGLEEIGMIECHTINANNPVNNQIHGISQYNKRGEQYLSAAFDYLCNRAENYLLALIS